MNEQREPGYFDGPADLHEAETIINMNVSELREKEVEEAEPRLLILMFLLTIVILIIVGVVIAVI